MIRLTDKALSFLVVNDIKSPDGFLVRVVFSERRMITGEERSSDSPTLRGRSLSWLELEIIQDFTQIYGSLYFPSYNAMIFIENICLELWAIRYVKRLSEEPCFW